MLGFDNLPVTIWRSLKWCVEFTSASIYESLVNIYDFET